MIMCVVKSPLSTLYRPKVTHTHYFHGAGVTDLAVRMKMATYCSTRAFQWDVIVCLHSR